MTYQITLPEEEDPQTKTALVRISSEVDEATGETLFTVTREEESAPTPPPEDPPYRHFRRWEVAQAMFDIFHDTPRNVDVCYVRELKVKEDAHQFVGPDTTWVARATRDLLQLARPSRIHPDDPDCWQLVHIPSPDYYAIREALGHNLFGSTDKPHTIFKGFGTISNPTLEWLRAVCGSLIARFPHVLGENNRLRWDETIHRLRIRAATLEMIERKKNA